jgi:oligosaccharide translocation protein RFT1
MAVNGITESFVASVAVTGDLARQSRAMIAFSAIFMCASWGLLSGLGMGAEGLVWANCINMGVRIIWSCQFIRSWYIARNESVGWNRVTPSRGTIISLVLIGVGLRMVSARGLNGFVEAACIVGVSGLSLLGCMYLPDFRD